MNKTFYYITFLCLFSFEALAEINFKSDILPFIEEYCIRCHGEEKQKGDRRYDSLTADFTDEKTAILWQDILDQLVLGEMPPKKPFPTSENNKKVINWISQKFQNLRDEKAVSKNGTVMRRLSHMEYSNSLKQLFNLDIPNFNLTRGLTSDNIIAGFDTEAKQLKTTPYLFAKYLEIADRFIEKALPPAKKPAVKIRNINAWGIRPNRDSILFRNGKSATINMVGWESSASRVFLKNFTSPEDGEYTITINAEGLRRGQHANTYYGGKKKEAHKPWRLRVIASNAEAGPLDKPNTSDYDITTLIINDKRQDYTFKAFIRKGFNLITYWENGPGGQPLAVRAQERVFKEVDWFESYKKIGKAKTFEKYYYGPILRLHSIKVKGPHFKEWPLPPVQTVFGAKPPVEPSLEYARKRLKFFAAKAWRRPVSDKELTPVYELVEKTIHSEGYQAIGKGLKAIICSPAFLYHNQNKGKLNNFALASRLSFFLTGSSPDPRLLRLAHQNKLNDPEIYKNEVNRLLASPELRQFVDNFTYQWLHLSTASEMPPDEQKFKNYYQLGIDKYMVLETQHFIKHLIDKNLSIFNCLDSNFAMLNKPLAEFYKINSDQLTEKKFVKVKLPKNNFRGGLLGQASVLTATSNGVDTSPVVRGVWVLEKLMGTHPAPPPADVEPLEPDIRGTKTIKDRLKAHREKESCNDCHRKFDYLGLALENLSPIGSFRKFYDKRKKVKIDSLAMAPDGSQIATVHELKKYLLKRKNLFARGLTEQLLAYATGRKMSYLERAEIDRIVSNLNEKNGFADLLKDIVHCETFRHK